MPRTRTTQLLIRFALTCAAALTSAALLGGCDLLPSLPGSSPRSDGSVETTPIADLAAVQITEYQGKDLSSIEDFRENSIKGPQSVDIDTYRLEIRGLVESPTVLTYGEVVALPPVQKLVTLNCVEGWSVDIMWEGVRLTELLDRAGADPSASTIIFRCADGYSTSLPQKFVRDRDLILAYEMNGVILPSERGFPFQLVAEDKLGYKWAKWIEQIEVSDESDFRGYWESRGYDNDAELLGR